jgi:hypothetical protein
LAKNNWEYFVNNTISYFDFAIWYVLEGNEFELPNEFETWRKEGKIKNLDALRKRIGERPKMIEWVKGREERK